MSRKRSLRGGKSEEKVAKSPKSQTRTIRDLNTITSENSADLVGGYKFDPLISMLMNHKGGEKSEGETPVSSPKSQTRTIRASSDHEETKQKHSDPEKQKHSDTETKQEHPPSQSGSSFMTAVELAKSFNVVLPYVPAHLPYNEIDRLRVLEEMKILDTDPEPHYDEIVMLAHRISQCPVALMSLVDAKRQWFKSSVGIGGARFRPRETSFCAHAIHHKQEFAVSDATIDPRFAGGPGVLKAGFRFYLGFPLHVNSYAVGTLCVLDVQPRKLTALQRTQLHKLSLILSQYLTLRHSIKLTESICQSEKLIHTHSRLPRNEVAEHELQQFVENACQITPSSTHATSM